jgi:hypothetical protein
MDARLDCVCDETDGDATEAIRQAYNGHLRGLPCRRFCFVVGCVIMCKECLSNRARIVDIWDVTIDELGQEWDRGSDLHINPVPAT